MSTDAKKTSISLKNLQDYDSKIKNIINNKVEKVTGKGLSTNDYSNADKTEVAKIKDKFDATTETTNAGKYVRVNNSGELVFSEVTVDSENDGYTINVGRGKTYTYTLPTDGVVKVVCKPVAGSNNTITISKNDTVLQTYSIPNPATFSYDFQKDDVLTIVCESNIYALVTLPNTTEGLIQNMIAPTWDSEKSYSLNDVVIYENIIYKCIKDVTSTTTPLEDTTNWKVTTASEASSINIVKEWSKTLSDNNIPSEKLVKENLDEYGITYMNFCTGRGANFSYTVTNTGVISYTNRKYASSYSSADIYKNNVKIDSWYDSAGSGSALFEEGDVLGIECGSNANVYVTVPIKNSEILNNIVANQWVSGNSYTKDTYVLFENGLYKCISNIDSSTTNPLMDDTNWSKILLGNVLANQGKEPLATNLSGASDYNSSTAYDVVGNSENKPSYCLYNNCMYKCINACTNILPTNNTYWEKFNLTSTPTFNNQTTLNKLSTSDDGKLLFDNKEVENTINNITNNNVTNTTVDGDMYLDIDKYSEEEVVVGTWIDGKPIYRKTISFDNVGNSVWYVVLSNEILQDLNVDEYVKLQGTMKCGNGQIRNMDLFLNGNTFSYLEIDNYGIRSYTVGLDGIVYASVIIEYTKTTDQPNSFTPGMVAGNLISLPDSSDEVYTDEEINTLINSIYGGTE